MEKIPSSLKKKNLLSFWDWVGEHFPSLTGAPSTQYYFDCEKTLFRTYAPHLEGKKVLKTDLWDEAKNSQILQWVENQGAQVHGLDISFQIANEAKGHFKEKFSGGLIVSDLRMIACNDESFDLIYSMGTIEHFQEHDQALRECYRVLKKGGIAIIGVPNKNDPFLRPLIVWILGAMDRYAYGYEKSFSRRELERMLQVVGFRVLDHSGILFMPGILRMIDLFLHVNWPKATVLTKPLIFPFSFLYKKFPSLRRHGYLITCIVQKP